MNDELVQDLKQFIEATVRQATADLVTKSDFDEKFASVDQQFAHINQQFARVDQQFARVYQQFAHIDTQFAQVDRQFAEVYRRLDNVQADIADALSSRNDDVDEQLAALNSRVDRLEHKTV